MVSRQLAWCQVQIKVASPRGNREVGVADEASLMFGSGEVGSMLGLSALLTLFPTRSLTSTSQ